MATAGPRSWQSGFLLGLVLGIVAASIPFLLLLFSRRTEPVTIVREVPVPAATAPAGGKEDSSAARKADAGAVGGTDQAGEEEEANAPEEEPVAEETGEDAVGPPDPEEAYRQRERELIAKLEEELIVRVTDEATGKPLPGVDVRVFLGTARNGGVSMGDRTGADGRAELWVLDLHEDWQRWRREALRAPPGVEWTLGSSDNPLRADVTIRAPGYEPYHADATGKQLDARLRPEREAWTYGTIRGRIVGKNGTPWTLPFEVGLQDPDLLDWIGVRVIPDATGRFEVPGVPPGKWGVKVDTGWGAWTEVCVPSGGTAEVDLRVDLLEEELEDRTGDLPEPRRPVWVKVARDLPRGGVVRLHGTWDAPLQATVAGQVASFPAVPVGEARVVLACPGRRDEAALLQVAEGAGIQEFEFPPER